MTAFFDSYVNWRVSYYVQIGLYVVAGVVLLLVKSTYVEEDKDEDSEDEDEGVSDSEMSESDFTSQDEGYMSNSSSAFEKE